MCASRVLVTPSPNEIVYVNDESSARAEVSSTPITRGPAGREPMCAAGVPIVTAGESTLIATCRSRYP